MKKYDRYKRINIPWLNEIPEHWKIESIKYFAKYYIGNSIKDEEKGRYTNNCNAIPYISTSSINLDNNKINYSNGLYIKKDDENFNVAFKNSTLVCIEGGRGGKKKGIISQNVCFGNKLCCIKSFKYNDKFIYYSTLSEIFNDNYCLNISGDRNGVSINKIKEFKFIIPTLSEQEQISKYLDWKIGEIDRLIEIYKNIIKIYNELENNYIDHEIENIKIYDSVKLGRLGEFRKGGGFSKQNIIKEGEFSAILYGDIYTKHKYILSIKQLRKIERNFYFTSLKVNKNTFMFTGSGETREDIGKCILYDGDEFIAVGGDIIAFNLNSKCIIPKYLCYFLNSLSSKDYKYVYSKGDIIIHIYSNSLKNILIKIPSIKEQRMVVDRIENLFYKLDLQRNIVYEKIKNMEEFKNSLISEVVTGKIDVRNVKIPDYEKFNEDEIINQDLFEEGIENYNE